MADELSRVLRASGFAGMAPHERAGETYWAGVSVATGRRVIARWRPQQAAKEIDVHAKLASAQTGVLAPLLAAVPFGSGMILVHELPKGQDLLEIVTLHRGNVPVSTFLRVAVGVAHAVAVCHAHRVFLGALSPRAFVFDADTGSVTVIDLPYCGLFGEPNLGSSAEGYVEYIAPEQTGRFGITPNYTADLYSMGAVLYHFACGRPPFEFDSTTDAKTGAVQGVAAFVRCILQERPRPLLEVNPTISFVASRVIDVLLEKSPFDRYKSAYGAWRDLQHAAALHATQGSASPMALPAFSAGVYDVESQPEFTDPLVPDARDSECATLLAAFANAVAGHATLVRIQGGRGIGKTVLGKFVLRQRPAPEAQLDGFNTSPTSALVSSPPFSGNPSADGSSAPIDLKTDDQDPLPDNESGSGSHGTRSHHAASDRDGSSSGASNRRAERPVIRGATCCDKLHGQTPYYPITSAVSGALKALMACSVNARTLFSDRVVATLCTNINIAVDAIPNLKYFVKEYVTPLHSDASTTVEELQNIVRQCLIDVICCLASVAKPLVLLIDDIQCADAGSVALLTQLVQHPLDMGLLLVLIETAPAADSAEVSHTHTLMLNATWPKQRLLLGPLPVIGVMSMVQRIAHMKGEDSVRLAAVLHARNDGNPQRIVQVLRLLYDGGALHFDVSSGRWVVDEEALDLLPMIDDSSDAVLITLGTLPKPTQMLLATAALLGDRVAMPLLATTVGVSVDEAYQLAQPALHRSIVVLDKKAADVSIPMRSSRRAVAIDVPALTGAEDVVTVPDASAYIRDLSLRFLFETARLTSLKLLTSDETKSLQYKIVRALLADVSDREQLSRDLLFNVVTRLRACDIASIEDEKPFVCYYAELFLEAASRARIATNFEDALPYARDGLALIGLPVDKLLTVDHIDVPTLSFPRPEAGLHGSVLEPVLHMLPVAENLVRQLMIELGQCKRFSGNYEAANHIFELALSISEGPLARAEVFVFLVMLQFMSGHIPESVMTGKRCLSELGVPAHLLYDCSKEEAEGYIDGVLERLDAARKAKDLTQYFADMPEVAEDEVVMRRHHMMIEVSTPAFFVQPYLQAYFVAMVVDDALKSGVSHCLALALSQTARTANMRGRGDMKFDIMDAALDLAARLANCRHRGRVRFSNVAFASWYRFTPSLAVKELTAAKSMCMSEGDVMYSAYCLLVKSYHLSMGPFPLKASVAEVSADIAFIKSTLLNDTVGFTQAQLTDMQLLMGIEPAMTKQDIMTSLSNSKLPFGLCLTAVGTVYSHYLLGRLPEALSACLVADATIDTMEGLYPYGIYQAFKGLTALKLERTSGSTELTASCLECARTVLSGLAVEAPIIFRSLHLLIEAEALSLKRDSYFQAIEMYDLAIKVAAEDAMIHYHALACELAGAFYLRCNAPQTGTRLLSDAVGSYASWGAFAVARRVQEEYVVAGSASSSLTSSSHSLSLAPSSSSTFGDGSGQQNSSMRFRGQSLAQTLDFDATVKFCQMLSKQHSLGDVMNEFKSVIRQCTNASKVLVVLASALQRSEAVGRQNAKALYGKVSPLFTKTTPVSATSRSTGISAAKSPQLTYASSAPSVGHDVKSQVSGLSATSVEDVEEEYPMDIVRSVADNEEPLCIESVPDSSFGSDAYLCANGIKSLLVVPIFNSDVLFGVVYMEQDEVRGAFTLSLLPVLNAIGTQLAISYESILNVDRLRQGNERLEELTKIKDRFLATLSHELKTPLHSMSLCLGLLGDTLLSQEQRNFVDVLTSSAAVLQRLLVDLMDLSKLRTGAVVLCPSPCNIQDLALEVIRRYEQTAAEKSVELVYLCPGELPKSVLVDPKRFKQMLSVFVDNGVKFSQPGGVVEVTFDAYSTSDEDFAGASVTQGLRISVRDTTGPGISSQFRERLFEPFSQQDSSDSRTYGGFGNGLALSKLIITQMHGTVSVESDGIKGSRFTVDLPITVLDQAEVMLALDNRVGSGEEVAVPPPARSQLSGKSLFCFCKKFEASADVVGSIAREAGMAFIRCGSLTDLRCQLREFVPESRVNIAVLVDEAAIGSDEAVIQFLQPYLNHVMCLHYSAIPTSAHVPDCYHRVHVPVLKDAVLEALKSCIDSVVLSLTSPSSVVTDAGVADLNIAIASAPPHVIKSTPPPPLPHPLTTDALPATGVSPRHPHRVDGGAGRDRKGSSSQSTPSPLHILIVEDNVVNAKLLRNILKRAGYSSDIAENGQIGVDMARANSYCIILMDIQMPVMNGLDATKNIRLFNSSVPIVAVSASVDEADRKSCEDVGMTDILTKPVQPNKLMSVLKSYVTDPR